MFVDKRAFKRTILLNYSVKSHAVVSGIHGGNNYLIKISGKFSWFCVQNWDVFFSIRAENLQRSHTLTSAAQRDTTQVPLEGGITLRALIIPLIQTCLHFAAQIPRNWSGAVQGFFQIHALTRVCFSWWNVSLLCNGCLNNGAFANAFCNCILRSMPRHYHKHSLKPTDDK